ncbi:hypothetical protein [Bradyrhizobium elkanii]|uniref:hypothetical protein n=1 Tax=Bradyrhizobium elkanii TaxID=29448 RepID=UPI002714A4C1|nr:hypothetical protein [Bradyrhizobium elkanii]WLA99873.1 hypothetical protein QNJ80_41920 [Bradyrhizobium elkanii]
MSKQRSEVLIRVTDDALIVANDGRPVSRLGVLALCASDLSEKSGREDEQPEDYPDTSDRELLQAIANSAIGVYRADANRPKRDLRHERGVTADYGGRYLWELIQNADDALEYGTADAAELIGTKGLGFISVLEITDRPEIFSRPFTFYFSKADTEALLRTRLGKHIRAPTFEIPHLATETPEISEILRQGYATAIRLPFRNAEIAANVRDVVERLDHRFLLLSQRIERLQIEVAGQVRKIEISRSPVALGIEEISLSMRAAGGHASVCRWTKWLRQWKHEGEDKRLSAAVCLPQGDDAVPRALAEDDKPSVYVFFPTDETIGARAIVHVSLEVTENRKHFRNGERNALVYARMRELIAGILAAVPAEVALDAFGRVDPKTASGAARELASTVLGAVKETPFVPTIGGEKVRPRDVTVWTGRFGTALRSDATELKSYHLLHPSVNGRNAVLKALDAKGISAQEFFGAMRYCRNGTSAECRNAVDVLLLEGLPLIEWQPHPYWIEQVPCWWTEKDSARPIAGGILLYSRPQQWPDFIHADALSPEAHHHLATIDAKLSADPSLKHRHGVWKDFVVRQFVHKGEYLEKALLPVMEKMTPQAWEEHGWDVLRWYREWSPERKFDDIPVLPIVWRGRQDVDPFRWRLSRALRLPTEKGWQSAEQCYAGRTWGAPKSFRAYFRDVGNRAVVRPLRIWREPLRREAELDLWKGLLRFAGVAWEPKLVMADLSDVTDEYKRRYLSGFNRCDFDLRIEHFPECLAMETRLLPTLEAGRTLLATAQKYPAQYLPPLKQKPQTLKTNFARHQLETTEWLPHRKSLLFPNRAVAATDVYLAGKGIEGLLPEIAVPDVEPRRRNELLRFLKSIGINDSLPTDGWAWIDWMQRLAEASRQSMADKGTLFEVAKTLYRRFFSLAVDEVYAPPGLRVPCFTRGETSEHLAFVPAREAKWLDQPIFEAPDIRRALLAHGYRIFILFLSQAEGADTHLGVSRLSDSVSLTPVSAGIDDEGTALTAAHYRSRIRALRAVVPEGQRALLKEDLRVEATPALSISMRAEGGMEIVAADVRAFRNQHGTMIVAGEGAYLRGLGMGLAHYVIGNPRHTAIFENILSATDDDEVIERLRDQGVPAQELDAVHEAMAKERTGSTISSHGRAPEDVEADAEGLAAPPTSTAVPAQPVATQSRPAGDRAAAAVRSAPSTATTASPTGGHSAPTRAVVGTTGQTAVRVERLGTNAWTTRGSGNWNPLAAAEAGQHAEDWLYTKLTAAFPGRPIVRNERDASNRESDFVVHFDERTFHIEVKRLGTLPGYIYWSDLEFAKCGGLGDEYCLAVLLPSSDEYEVAWLWRPALELANAERFVDWIWEGRRSDQLPDGSWQPVSPPPMPPRSFTYRIALTSGLIGSLPRDAADLALLKSRVVNWPAAQSAKAASGP